MSSPLPTPSATPPTSPSLQSIPLVPHCSLGATSAYFDLRDSRPPSLKSPSAPLFPQPPSDLECGLPPAIDIAFDQIPSRFRPLVDHLISCGAVTAVSGYTRSAFIAAIGHCLNVRRAQGGAGAVLVVTASDAIAALWMNGLQRIVEEITVERLGTGKTPRENVERILKGRRMPGVVVAPQKAVREDGMRMMRTALNDNPHGIGWDICISDAVREGGLNSEWCPLRMLADRQTDSAVVVVCREDESKAVRKAEFIGFVEREIGMVRHLDLWWSKGKMATRAKGEDTSAFDARRGDNIGEAKGSTFAKLLKGEENAPEEEPSPLKERLREKNSSQERDDITSQKRMGSQSTTCTPCVLGVEDERAGSGRAGNGFRAEEAGRAARKNVSSLKHGPFLANELLNGSSVKAASGLNAELGERGNQSGKDFMGSMEVCLERIIITDNMHKEGSIRNCPQVQPKGNLKEQSRSLPGGVPVKCSTQGAGVGHGERGRGTEERAKHTTQGGCTTNIPFLSETLRNSLNKNVATKGDDRRIRDFEKGNEANWKPQLVRKDKSDSRVEVNYAARRGRKVVNRDNMRNGCHGFDKAVQHVRSKHQGERTPKVYVDSSIIGERKGIKSRDCKLSSFEEQKKRETPVFCDSESSGVELHSKMRMQPSSSQEETSVDMGFRNGNSRRREKPAFTAGACPEKLFERSRVASSTAPPIVPYPTPDSFNCNSDSDSNESWHTPNSRLRGIFGDVRVESESEEGPFVTPLSKVLEHCRKTKPRSVKVSPVQLSKRPEYNKSRKRTYALPRADSWSAGGGESLPVRRAVEGGRLKKEEAYRRKSLPGIGRQRSLKRIPSAQKSISKASTDDARGLRSFARRKGAEGGATRKEDKYRRRSLQGTSNGESTKKVSPVLKSISKTKPNNVHGSTSRVEKRVAGGGSLGEDSFFRWKPVSETPNGESSRKVLPSRKINPRASSNKICGPNGLDKRSGAGNGLLEKNDVFRQRPARRTLHEKSLEKMPTVCKATPKTPADRLNGLNSFAAGEPAMRNVESRSSPSADVRRTGAIHRIPKVKKVPNIFCLEGTFEGKENEVNWEEEAISSKPSNSGGVHTTLRTPGESKNIHGFISNSPLNRQSGVRSQPIVRQVRGSGGKGEISGYGLNRTHDEIEYSGHARRKEAVRERQGSERLPRKSQEESLRGRGKKGLSRLDDAKRNRYNELLRKAEGQEAKRCNDLALHYYMECCSIYDGDEKLRDRILALATSTRCLRDADFGLNKSRSPISKDKGKGRRMRRRSGGSANGARGGSRDAKRIVPLEIIELSD